MLTVLILTGCLILCEGVNDDRKWSAFLRELQRAMETSEKTVIPDVIKPSHVNGTDGDNTDYPSYRYTIVPTATFKPTDNHSSPNSTNHSYSYSSEYSTYNSYSSSISYEPFPSVIAGSNVTYGIKPKPEGGSAGCSFLNDMIRDKMSGFPTLDDEISKTSIELRHFQTSIQQSIAAYRVLPNDRLLAMDLTEKVANIILDNRLRCTTLKYQKVIYNLLADGVSKLMNRSDDALRISLTTMMMQIGLSPAEKWANHALTILHDHLFNTTMDQLLLLTLQDVNSLAVTLEKHFREAFKTQPNEQHLMKILKSDLRDHPGVLNCTSPKKVRSMNVMVVMSLLKRLGLLTKAEAIKETERILANILNRDIPVNAEFVKILTAVIKPTIYGIRQYEQSLMYGSFKDSLEFLETHLDKNQLIVAETLLEHMGWSGQTFQPVLASYIMRPARQYIEDAINTAEMIVKDVKVFEGNKEELKSFIIRNFASWIVKNQAKINEIERDYMIQEPSM